MSLVNRYIFVSVQNISFRVLVICKEMTNCLIQVRNLSLCLFVCLSAYQSVCLLFLYVSHRQTDIICKQILQYEKYDASHDLVSATLKLKLICIQVGLSPSMPLAFCFIAFPKPNVTLTNLAYILASSRTHSRT